MENILFGLLRNHRRNFVTAEQYDDYFVIIKFASGKMNYLRGSDWKYYPRILIQNYLAS